MLKTQTPARLATKAALFSVLAASPLLASPADPEDWLPEETLLHLRVDDPRLFLASIANHPFAALLREPEVAAFVEALAETVPATAKAEATARAFEISTILSVLDGPATASVLGFPSPGSPPDLLVTVGVGEVKAFEAGIALGVEALSSGEDGATAGRVESEGVTIRTLDLSGVHVAYAIVGSTFLVSNRDGVVAAAAAAVRDGASGRPLSGRPGWRVTAEALGAGSGGSKGLSAYVNLAAFLPGLLERAETRDRTLLRCLGLDRAAAIGWRLTVRKSGVVERVAIASPDGFDGFVGSLPLDGGGLESTAAAPAGSLVSAAMRIDPVRAWDATLAALSKGEPLAHEIFMDDVGAFEKGFGQSVRDDLLASLDGEARLTVSLRPESPVSPDMNLCVGVKNASAIRAAAQRFAETLRGFEIRAIEYGGETIFVPGAPEAALAAISPAFCATADALIVSVNPDSLKRALAARESGAPTIADDPLFAAFSREFSSAAGAPFGAQYFDGGQAFSLVYNALVPLLQSFARPLDLPFDAALIPSAESITRHVSASICAVSRRDKALVVSAFGPVPSPVGPLALVASGAALGRAAARGDVAPFQFRAAPAAARPPRAATAPTRAALVTLSRTDVPLGDLLREISEASGIQFAGPEPLLMQMRVSLRLENVPAGDAVRIACEAAGLVASERTLADGRTVVIVVSAR